MINYSRILSRKIFSLLLIFVMVFTLSSCRIGESFDNLSLYLDDLVNQSTPVYQSDIQISEPLAPISYEDRYGYKSLNKEQRLIYDRINQAALSYNRSVDLGDLPVPINDFLRIYYYYLDDHPEVFWLGSNIGYTHDYSGKKITNISMQYIGKNSSDSFSSTTGKNDEKVSKDEILAMRTEFDTKINQILQVVSSGENLLARELKIYRYIAENVTYDMTLYNQIMSNAVKRPISQSAYGAAVEGRTVCTGYAKMFSILANAIGIECLSQYGQLQGNLHQWNVVRLDGKYYNVDATNPTIDIQNTTIVNYSYFNITDQDIKKTHTIGSNSLSNGFQVNYTAPSCDATENSFNALFAIDVSGDSLDQNDFQQKIARLHAYKFTELYFHFPEGSTSINVQNFMNTNTKQMKRLASGYFTFEKSFYYLEPNSALINLDRK